MKCILKVRWVFLLLAIGLIACEREIDLAPGQLEPKLVVEASIENDAAPLVVLTTSFNYFNTLTAEMVAESFVRNARVRLSDGRQTALLQEVAVTTPRGKFYYYTTIPGSFLGRLNTSYSLSIEANGKSYSAQTTIPALNKQIDSLWWQKAPNNPDTNRVVVFSRVFDPPGFGNYIRYYTSVNDSAFIPGLNSVFDDQIVDGTTYDIQVFRGQDRNRPVNNDEFGYFRRGDTVAVQLSNIDKATFDFWRTWEQNQSNLNNPFGVPVKILGNIQGGAAGYFGGYSSSIRRLIIPR